MKNFKNIGLTLFCLLFTQICFSQQLSKRARLNQMAEKFKIQEENEKAEAKAWALQNGYDTVGLFRLNEFGNPVYYLNENNQAAGTVNTLYARSTYSLDGKDMKIGLWEAATMNVPNGSIPLLSHQDFQGRVTIADGTFASNHTRHATHVAGTMIGDPPNSAGNSSRGMAPEANMDAYNISNHNAEMASAGAASIEEVTNGKLLISNHSYGSNEGWSRITGTVNWQWNGGTATFVGGGVDPSWGVYTSSDVAWDDLTWAAEYYLVCKSSGNQNTDNPTIATTLVRDGAGGILVPYDTSIHPLGDGLYAGGFRTVSSGDLGKNILTVGAVDNSNNIANFSCTGPTGDGRIKPDIVGVGVGVNSADNASIISYTSLNGTSMSTPNVSGSLLLLQEKYRDDFKVGDDSLFMKAATLKGLAIHTAQDLGNPGPDYTYGWGRLDMQFASNVINDDAWKTGSAKGQHMIIEDSIMTAMDVYEIFVNTGGGTTNQSLFRATLCYADSTGSTLRNDLDLKVFNMDTNQALSTWLLDPNNPGNNATGGDDDINNVESSVFPFDADQTIRIRVELDGTTLFDDQPVPFSLIISGLSTSCKASIQHKVLDLESDTYIAEEYIKSQAILATSGREIDYRTNGKIELKPGFHARAQNSTGAGYFKTSVGSCP